MSSKQNFVAKHMNTNNRASTHRDKKNDYVRQATSVNDCLDEYLEESEAFIEDFKES